MVEFSVPTGTSPPVTARQTPIPRNQIAAVIFVQTCEGINSKLHWSSTIFFAFFITSKNFLSCSQCPISIFGFHGWRSGLHRETPWILCWWSSRLLSFSAQIFASLINRFSPASFCGAQFCSSIIWGRISDAYGRKPAVIAGTLGAAVGMLVFGFAKTYTQAVLGKRIVDLMIYFRRHD